MTLRVQPQQRSDSHQQLCEPIDVQRLAHVLVEPAPSEVIGL
jgi:hypothetical protein